MKSTVGNFIQTLQILKQDKVVLGFSFSPIAIGGVLYYFLGSWVYGDVLDKGRAWIENSLASGAWGSVLYYIFMAILTAALFFLINWTFVLVISVLASPFNDLISSRVEKIVGGKQPESLSQSVAQMMKKSIWIVFNEGKKIIFILSLTILSFLLSLIPFLAPVSIGVSAILLAINFLDYSWSRHDMGVGECIKSLRKNLLVYTTGGLGFLLLMSLPIVNLFALPLAVIYFSILFTKGNPAKVEVEDRRGELT